jgi:hypothetical protein
VITLIHHLWNRLPKIAMYTFAFWALFFVVEHLYFRFAPADHFLKYRSVFVQDAEEGDDVRFSACRDKDANYHITGTRTFYRISENEPEPRRRIQTIDVDTTLENSECANLFIAPDDFYHEPGKYMFVSDLCFFVFKYEKCITHETNVYEIRPRHNLTPAEIQQQIEELQRQIDALKAQLAMIPASRSISNSTSQTTTPQANSRSAESSPRNDSPGPPDETQSPSPPRESIIPGVNEPLIGCPIGGLCL